MKRSLSELKRRPLETVLADLKSTNTAASRQAGENLVREAMEFGLPVKDFLTLAIDPRQGEFAQQINGNGPLNDNNRLNGYELALAHLNLPVRNDFNEGVVLQAAADTFATFPGTRLLFPPVVDDMLKWSYRQDQIEKVAPMLANSRTIVGNEMISTVMDDDSSSQDTNTIAELGRVPIQTVRATENSVKMWKHGSGYRTSYEFSRRVSLDILTPFANRVQRKLEISKVAAATSVLVSGDGVNSAAPVLTQASLDDSAVDDDGKIHYKSMLKWLVGRARAGTPVDTVVGNWDAYIEWLMLFALPSGLGQSDAEALAKAGVKLNTKIPVLNFDVGFVLSSTMTGGALLGFSRGDTLEELIEANSQIAESERAIGNQSITYVRTENSGYKLAFNDTRSIYDFSQQ